VECAEDGTIIEHIPWSDGKRPVIWVMMGSLARLARRLSWREMARAAADGLLVDSSASMASNCERGTGSFRPRQRICTSLSCFQTVIPDQGLLVWSGIDDRFVVNVVFPDRTLLGCRYDLARRILLTKVRPDLQPTGDLGFADTGTL